MASHKAGSLKQKKGGAGDGSHVPEDSVLLDGDIITASSACMGERNYERGYPEPEEFLHMRNSGKGTGG
jgi:hypothetical protein